MHEIKNILERIQRYCAYRERCLKEVRLKLNEWSVSPKMSEEIFSRLISSGYLNEERFAQFYVSGKFRHNSWGRMRIVRELEFREISPRVIKKALEHIDEKEYVNELQRLIFGKVKGFDVRNDIEKKNRVAQYCIRKGYEATLVWEILNKKCL